MCQNKISVVIPYIEPAPFLQETLHSLEQQTINSDLEIITVEDDGSGISATRNRGLRKASGEFIYFIDSDDVLVSNKVLEIARDVLLRDPSLDFVYGDLIKGDEDLNPIGRCNTPLFHGENLRQYLCHGGAILLQTMFFRNRKREVFFNTVYDYCEDLDYILRRTYFEHGTHISMYMIVHREHANSVSYRRGPGKARSIVKTVEIFGEFLHAHPEICDDNSMYNRIMAVQSIIRVHMLHRFYYRREAWDLMISSLRYFPYCITGNIVRILSEFLIPVPIASKIRQGLTTIKKHWAVANPYIF